VKLREEQTKKVIVFMNAFPRFIVASLFALGSWNAEVFGQVECTPQGNLRGLRVDGELMAFSTSIRAVAPTGAAEDQGGTAADDAASMGPRLISRGNFRDRSGRCGQ